MLNIQSCLARAHDLTSLADREPSYDLILLYDDLAREWRRMARMIEASGRAARETLGDHARRLQGGPGPVSLRDD